MAGRRKSEGTKGSRYVPLRYRFIAVTSILLILLLGTTAILLGIQQGRSIRSQLERRGLAVAQSLAAASKAALATYNYLALEQVVNQVAQDPDILYAVIHDKEGRVGGYSGRPDLQGKRLEDQATAKALSSSSPVIQEIQPAGSNPLFLEVSLPIYIPGSDLRWGTVRIALSLQHMVVQIRQIRLIIAGIGGLALAIGIVVSAWAARRITRPLGELMRVTVEAAKGNLDQEVHVATGDEVEVLASNFAVMIREILAQRNQLEIQLREITRLQQYTEKLLTTMNDGLISIDRDGRVAAINPAAAHMLGIDEVSGIGDSIETLGSGADELLAYMRQMLEPAYGGNQREIQVLRNGEQRIILANCSPLLDKEGEVVELITNLHDVTELKKLEAKMRQTERLAALGILAAGMAHEIRNPLSAIKTFVQLLPRKIDRPDFLVKFQRTVPRELERINRLIEDLLELARDPKYHFAPVNLRGLLLECTELVDEELAQRGVRIDFSFRADREEIWADSDQLIKAFQNLVRNAVQAMAEGGDLGIDVREVDHCPMAERNPGRERGWVLLTFRDTGAGMTPESLKSIFNPFFTTKDTGTGLGLAITHKVITEHGGAIEVESTLGVGSTFRVYLPSMEKAS